MLAILPSFLTAQEAGIPEELQQEVLSQHPGLDADGDGKISRKEFKKGGQSIPQEEREKIMQALAGDQEDLQTQAAKSQLEGLGLSGEQGIKYKESKQDRCYLDIVHPKNKLYEKAPLLIFIHGGGYHGGDRSLLYRPDSFGLAQRASEQGIAVATLGYRLIGKEKEVRMVHLNQDIKDALRYLAQNSDRFAIDPNKMITLGQSAGGSLALIAALTPSDYLPGAVSGPDTQHTVVGCINYFGPTHLLWSPVSLPEETSMQAGKQLVCHRGRTGHRTNHDRLQPGQTPQRRLPAGASV
ncbi:MAG: carboxylesterase family protein [Bdellovibrionaceae bacterium]|nr:carboxylesterase family protein [Pseudobdellovibrionaceae bacterium]